MRRGHPVLRPRAALLTLSFALSVLVPCARAHGASWAQLPTHTPGPVVSPWDPLVWDATTARILYAEGATLWSLAPGGGPAWTSMAVAGPPPGVDLGVCAVFDAPRDRALFFGGSLGGNVVDQVWELSLAGPPAWSLLSTSGPGPSPRHFASAVVDPAGQRMIVFGGGDNNGTQYNDVYALSLTGGTPTWTTLVADGAPGSPSPRERHSALYDPVRERMVVFGGVGPGGLTNDVWTLSLDGPPPVWASLPTTGAPSPRNQHAAAYDAANDRMIVHGGFDGGTPNDAAALPFAGPAQWEALPPLAIGIGYGHAAVYDPAGQRMLVPSFRETHALDLGATPAWSLFERHILPLTRAVAAVAADSRHLVVVGGQPGPGVWTLDLADPAASWVRADVAGGPQDRFEVAMVWDPLRSRLLAYGGVVANGGEFADLWSLTLGPPAVWTPLSTAGDPPPAGYGWHGVYDPSGDRLVFLAFDAIEPCCAPPTYINTIFVLPLSGGQALKWKRHDVLPLSFRGRAGASLSYDAGRDVAWIYGGEDSTWTRLGELWQVALAGVPSVSAAATSGIPPTPRAHHAAHFDGLRDRLVVFGGRSGGGAGVPRDDLWQLEPAAGHLWSPLAPGGGVPPARYHAADAFDATGDRLLVFGGTGPTGTLDDTWALGLTDTPIAVLLSLAALEATPDRVRIVWMGAQPGMSVRVDRRETGGWESVGALLADDAGRIVCEDRLVMPGMRLEYRVAVVESGSEIHLGHTRVLVPSWALSIAAVPAPDGIVLRIHLPSAEAATVALFDLAGRTVWRRAVSPLGPGVHDLRVDGATPRAGVYFARLTQGAGARVARVAVFR